ncbi:MAG: response regulator [Burkholderiales bacterium]|nr:response regulator [Burkholderiales bacterium]
MNVDAGTHQKTAHWNVLIIDDDAFVAAVMAEMLRNLGVAQVTICANGKEAGVNLMANRVAPDLVLCDLHMPGKDGFQVMEELAATGFRGGVLLVSGQQNHVLHSASIMARFHRLNFIGALEKPVTPEQLRNALTQLKKD